MKAFLPIDISATGLMVQRLRMDIIASNIANAETTRTFKGTPYRRKDLLVAAVPIERVDFSGGFGETLKAAVPVRVVSDPRPFKLVYNPSHPDADSKGYVKMPNVNPLEEMVNMISAIRAYEANVTVINNTKSMFIRALDIAR